MRVSDIISLAVSLLTASGTFLIGWGTYKNGRVVREVHEKVNGMNDRLRGDVTSARADTTIAQANTQAAEEATAISERSNVRLVARLDNRRANYRSQDGRRTDKPSSVPPSSSVEQPEQES